MSTNVEGQFVSPNDAKPLVSRRWFSWGINIANLLLMLWLQTKFSFIESFIIFFSLVMINYLHGLLKGKSLGNGG